MLGVNEPRCQGAVAVWASPIQRGSLPADCCNCLRRTDIVPGHPHTYQQAPTWLPWDSCPSKVAPQPVIVLEDE